MTSRRIRSNLILAGTAGTAMVIGAYLITNAPNDAFALLGLTVGLAGIGLAAMVAWRVAQ